MKIFVIEYVWMRYWKFLKKFPVQTIVVKAVGKGDLDNLLEAIGNDFSDFDSSYCLCQAGYWENRISRNRRGFFICAG